MSAVTELPVSIQLTLAGAAVFALIMIIDAVVARLGDMNPRSSPMRARAGLRKADRYWGRGDVDGAHKALMHAITHAMGALGPRDPLTIRAGFELGRTHLSRGEIRHAVSVLDQTLEFAEGALGADDELTVACRRVLDVARTVEQRDLAVAA